jgi:hypothetical protein
VENPGFRALQIQRRSGLQVRGAARKRLMLHCRLHDEAKEVTL